MRLRFGFFRIKSICIGLAVTIILASCSQLTSLPRSSVPEKSDELDIVAQPFQPISDIPIPQGAKLDPDVSLVLGRGDYWTGRLVISLRESASDAFALYLKDMQNFGWNHITSVQTDISILSFAKKLRVANIQIENRTLGGSKVTIVMSPRALEMDESGSSTSDGIIRAQSID
tara:strand:- start:5526 stop:6044 length:519 start_codon:yes stop_codon:yes gene_type:complete